MTTSIMLNDRYGSIGGDIEYVIETCEETHRIFDAEFSGKWYNFRLIRFIFKYRKYVVSIKFKFTNTIRITVNNVPEIIMNQMNKILNIKNI